MNDMNSEYSTPAGFRSYFLRTYGREIIDVVCKAALGKKCVPETASGSRLKDCWELLSSIMLQAPDTLPIKASTSADIEAALAEGRITIAEMKQLMEALRTKNEAEILPDLERKLAEHQK